MCTLYSTYFQLIITVFIYIYIFFTNIVIFIIYILARFFLIGFFSQIVSNVFLKKKLLQSGQACYVMQIKPNLGRCEYQASNTSLVLSH